MGNFASGLYFDLKIKKREYNRVKRDELYRYAYFFDGPDSMLINKGYDAKTFCNITDVDIMDKAIMRSEMELPGEFNCTPKGRFCYLTGLPKDLLKNCAFQKRAKTFWNLAPADEEIKYDEDTLLWALKYRGIDECRI
jgi:hypothetical protein